MKKILILTIALLLMTLSLSSCEQDSIETSPVGPHLATYEIVYTICQIDGTTTQCVNGKDADGNVYYCDTNGQVIVFRSRKIPVSSNFYRQFYDTYVLNTETNVYEFVEKDSVVSFPSFRELYRTSYVASQQGSYKKIEALTLPDHVSGDLIFLDSEKFDYYSVSGTYTGKFEAAVEKVSGMCYYAHYENGYLFYVSQYTTPYEGNYADLLPEVETQLPESETQPSED